MSKLIKSNNAIQASPSSKEIKVKSIVFPNTYDGDVNDNDHSVARQVHYVERGELMKQAEAEAQLLIDEAKFQVESMKEEIEMYQAQIEQEAEKRYAEAFEAGTERGYQDGLLKGQQDYETCIQKAKEIVAKAEEDYYKHIEDSEEEMLELAIKLAKKIIGNTFNETNEAWVHLLREAVMEIRGQEEVRIYVNPHWYELTLQHLDELKQLALHTNKLYIYPDNTLSESSCIIETPFGQVDASLDSQLNEMKRVLVSKLNEGVANEI
ncbi:MULTISPECIES: flagellar assembly protein FliH [Bacillaceae]|uniref:Flagellar assembly protein FliH n=1 Tax=Evansella alkalicola TaxID=745819 RepID=A0ABS6JPA6_9BACI|nr:MULTISPECIES: flagellar assembly protein FliH [Bacillaceae]MBU9720318.1 flagellar assembly protein FliH [Bacillus alkalicola]